MSKMAKVNAASFMARVIYLLGSRVVAESSTDANGLGEIPQDEARVPLLGLRIQHGGDDVCGAINCAASAEFCTDFGERGFGFCARVARIQVPQGF